jgi:RNA polymerase sigma factor (TIGR02999 family)
MDDLSRSGSADPDITRLLISVSNGDTEAMDRLIPLIYDDLRAIAHMRIATEQDGHTLNTTAVVHEAYMRLARSDAPEWRDRAHFFAVASKVKRHVLIDYARKKRTEKRGGGVLPVPLLEGDQPTDPPGLDVLAVDEALTRLATHDPHLERLVECRFFGGMSMEETAEALGISVRTATRQWRRARAYLQQALQS